MEQSKFHDAVASGDQEKVAALLHDGTDIEENNSYGWTPLMVASAGGYVDLARFLVDHGADLHALNREGQSPLHLAAMRSRPDACRLLIRLGADVNAHDTLESCTPLHSAAMRHSKSLIIQGCYKSLVMETCSVLLGAGADVNARLKWGITALVITALTWQHELVDLLVQHGADLEARDNGSRTALLFVAYHCFNPHISAQLLAHGADVNTRDDKGRTVLVVAAHTLQQSLIDGLLDRGADINFQDAYGRTALMYAAGRARKGNAIESLEAEVNTMAEAGNTSHLDFVKKTERLAKYYHVRAEVVQHLLARGADPALRDFKGITALDVALEHGRRTGGHNAEVVSALSSTPIPTTAPLLNP